MSFTVVYDACVLHPAALRDLLVRLAASGIIQARWSEKILDECFESILAVRKDLRSEALARTRALMREAVPDCLITGFEGLIEALSLPDPDDRHVLAAAIKGGAQIIVTTNIKDFPRGALAPYHIEAQHPDDFVIDAVDWAPAEVLGVLREQAAALKNPPRTVPQLLETLRDQGLVQSVARLRELLGKS